MHRFVQYLLPFVVCLCLAGTSSAGIVFPGSASSVCGADSVCVARGRCPQLNRPTQSGRLPQVDICGFHGNQLNVCCPQAPARPRALPPTECGRGGSRLPSGGRGIAIPNIINGKLSERARWPWLVLIGHGHAADGQPNWQCHGALLSRRHVLTAAHCLAPPEQLTVRLAEFDLTTRQDGQHLDLAVLRTAAHPAKRRSQNDLAVLFLAEPVTFDSSVQPICLPTSEHRQPTVGYVAGWGRLQFGGNTAEQLQEAEVILTDPKRCEEAYKQALPFMFDFRFPGGFNGTKLCARGVGGSGAGTCQGDSGGPLMVQSPDGRFSVVGVVSIGTGCGIPEFPGIYTRVTSYLDWINSQLQR